MSGDCGDGMCWQAPLCEVIDDYKRDRATLLKMFATIAADTTRSESDRLESIFCLARDEILSSPLPRHT